MQEMEPNICFLFLLIRGKTQGFDNNIYKKAQIYADFYHFKRLYRTQKRSFPISLNQKA